MKILTAEQYTPEYWAAHRGIPGASSAAKVFTATGKMSDQAPRLIEDLIAQLYDPHYGQHDDIATKAMRDGHAIEPHARRFYEFERNLDVEQVGFCTTDDGRFGCSPDALVGDEGGVEIKSPKHSTQVKYLLAGKVPSEYVPQIHWSLIVTGRAWWDFLSYASGLPKLLIRVEADDYTERMREAMEAFYLRYQVALADIRALSASASADESAFEDARREDAIARAF